MYKDIPNLKMVENPQQRHMLRQYVLNAPEVAALLNMTQQGVNKASARGTLESLTIDAEQDDSGKVRRRYSLRDAVAYAKKTSRQLHVYTLPIRFMQEYDVSELSIHADIVVFAGDGAGLVRQWMSESEAARTLHVSRPTLRTHRLGGRLNPEVQFRDNPNTAVGGAQYHVDGVRKVIEGEIELVGS